MELRRLECDMEAERLIVAVDIVPADVSGRKHRLENVTLLIDQARKSPHSFGAAGFTFRQHVPAIRRFTSGPGNAPK